LLGLAVQADLVEQVADATLGPEELDELGLRLLRAELALIREGLALAVDAARELQRDVALAGIAAEQYDLAARVEVGKRAGVEVDQLDLVAQHLEVESRQDRLARLVGERGDLR